MHDLSHPTALRISRRSLGLGGGAVIAAGLATSALSPAPAEACWPAGGVWMYRAVRTYDVVHTAFAVDDGSCLYHERLPHNADENLYSYEWPFSQMRGASLDLTGMPGGKLYDRAFRADTVGQSRYFNPRGSTGLPGYASYPMPPWGGGGDFFYDDNEWVALFDIQRYLLAGDKAALADAKMIFELVVSGWDTDTTHPAPGGVFWTQASWSHDRNTVSNMPGAELGVRLYLITRDRRYLDWALRMYAWTNQSLQTPEGLYWDNVHMDGSIDKTIWSYNQGVPIGVNALLYEATGDRKYLREARRIAGAAASYYSGGKLEQQPPYFNAIYFKNLLLLASCTGDRTAAARMAEYAQWAWDNRRDRTTGLFVFPNDDATRPELLENAAMIQIMAVLAWNQRNWRCLY